MEMGQDHLGHAPRGLLSRHCLWRVYTKDGDLVRVHNDFSEFKIHVKLTSAARSKNETRPGQIMIYHAWEPFQFEKWHSYDSAIPGMRKWLDLAAGYGHLDYYRWNWGTQPVDRAVSVEVEKA